MTTVEPPSGDSEIVRSDWWSMGAGNTDISGTSSVHSYDLIGVTLLSVDREGLQHDIITTGTPGNRQCKHDSITGVVDFDPTNPSNGETVFVMFKE